MSLEHLLANNADMRGMWEKGCAGKVRYPSEQSAEFVKQYNRRTLGRHYDPDGERLSVYHCRFCGSWHLGHE